jgi:hypothetical protein
MSSAARYTGIALGSARLTVRATTEVNRPVKRNRLEAKDKE